jgi:pimeloyl-ACP methyl ester carboxylesterase
MPLAASEVGEVDAANASGRVPVLFVHGLWLRPECWREWRWLFESEGFAAVLPGWPGEVPTFEAARADPAALADLSIADITRHCADVIARLERLPVLIGHSLGGLVVQQLAARGLAAAAVAVSPAPHRGVLPLPLSSLRATWPALRDPRQRRQTVVLSPAEFRYAFANALRPDDAERVYAEQAVAAPARPLFELALANLNPATPARVDVRAPQRGPLLVVSGERDRVIPPRLARATVKRQRRNAGVTEYVEVPGRGHSLVVDAGWEQVAQLALEFVSKQASTDG